MAYMPITPGTSVSHADGIRSLLIMLMTVQGTMPMFSSIDVQHCSAVMSSRVSSIQRRMPTAILAIFISAAAGTFGPTLAYALTASSCSLTAGSSSFMRSIQPASSLRSSVSTLMPLSSSSFSLKRTVLKAAGRAPSMPIRALRSPLTTRQVAVKLRRSDLKLALFGSTVCSAVSVYGMPYWDRLLQADILPQNESRRSLIVIRSDVSGKACTSTGTSRPDQRRVSAIGRSSPKLGSVSSMPSMSSRRLLNRSAHFCASFMVWTAPYRVSSGVRQTASMPSLASRSRMILRPESARCLGKNPRLPTITPRVDFLLSFICPPCGVRCQVSVGRLSSVVILAPCAKSESSSRP